jgi:hypothetical protein
MSHLNEVFAERMVNMRTHPNRDLAILKMFQAGFGSTGDIQPARITAQAKADVATQLYAKRLYLPDWRKKAIEKIQRAEQEASETKDVGPFRT